MGNFNLGKIAACNNVKKLFALNTWKISTIFIESNPE